MSLDQPLKQILHKPEATGHLVKQSVEPSKFDISYQHRITIKTQVLTDFVTKYTRADTEVDNNHGADEENTSGAWMVIVDGSDGE